MVTLEILAGSLRRARIRATPQRLAICEALANSTDHPTAHMLYRQIKGRYPSLSLTTVYNTLDVLVGLGVVNTLGQIGDNHIHYDARTEPHINLACTRCHQIVDIDSAYMALLDQELMASSGYRLLGARVLYYGVCPACQNRSGESPGALPGLSEFIN
jgi:Fur family peroxide stress response transcriptional regulator